MCATSAVFDYFGQRPELFPPFPAPFTQPTPVPFPARPAWTRESFDEFKQIMERLDALDMKLGQPDCDAPEKKAWMDEVERRLAALEGGALDEQIGEGVKK